MSTQHDRKALLRHLEAVHVGGFIPEAVFEPDGSTRVTDTTTQLALQAPPLTGPPLAEQHLRVYELGKLATALERFDGERVTLTVDGGLLTLEEAHYHHPLMRPKQVQAKPPEDLHPHLHDPPVKEGVPTGTEGLRQVLYHDRLLDAQTARLEVSPEGTRIVIGAESGAHGDPQVPELISEEEYELTINFEHLAKVLKTVGEAGRLYVTGPERPLVVERNSYRYVLSPKVEPSS